MRARIIFALLMNGVVVLSCQSSKLKKEAENKASEFFAALKEGNEQKLTALYPGFSKFDAYYKSDSARINYTTENKGFMIVSVHNRFTNGYGKVTEKDMSLFLKKDSSGTLRIIDSKGLTGFDDEDEYTFGSQVGCIDKSMDTTDQQILRALAKAKPVMLEKAVEFYLQLKRDIRVVDWNWESGYGGSGSGKGIVKNNSTLSVPNLKYKITYKNSRGDEITSDDGYVDYDQIDPGESKSFTFYTGYIGSASHASIELVFEEKLIYKYLAGQKWTGSECDDYFKRNPDKATGL